MYKVVAVNIFIFSKIIPDLPKKIYDAGIITHDTFTVQSFYKQAIAQKFKTPVQLII